MTQNEAILKHLRRNKTITQLEATYQLGCLRLSERIRELKSAGHKIGGHMVRVKTRYGAANVKRYYLAR
jgi:hypothetical protein